MLTGQPHIANEELRQRLNNEMMDSAEVMPIESAIPHVQQIEFDHGVILPAHEILKTYWLAADQMIDSYISNEHDTPQPEGQRAARIAQWERMRPATRRRSELLKKLAAMT